jgi:hypothetical protein
MGRHSGAERRWRQTHRLSKIRNSAATANEQEVNDPDSTCGRICGSVGGMGDSYWKRRWQNTRRNAWPGFTPQVLVVNAIGLLAGFASSYWFAGGEFAQGELKSWLFFTFSSVLAANLILLVMNWILSAARIAEEDRLHVLAMEKRLEVMETSSRRIVEAKLSELKLRAADLLATHVETTFSITINTIWTLKEEKEFSERRITLNSLAVQLDHHDRELSQDLRDCVHLADCVISDMQSRSLDREDRNKLSALRKSVIERLYARA